jgi:hypothetical protein
MTTRSVFLIGMMLLLLSCQQEQHAGHKSTTPLAGQTDTLSKTTGEAEPERRPLSPLTYENVFLICGGSPSISTELTMANLYSSRVQKFMDNNYKVLNTAIAQEPNARLMKRLPMLFRHQVAVFVLEIGADEEKKGLSGKKISEKLNLILQFVQQQRPVPQIIIVPSTSKKIYLNALRQTSGAHPDIQLLPPAEFAPYTAEWHEYVARQLSKMVE